MGVGITRRGDADLVERYINTAYDNVKAVADALPELQSVHTALATLQAVEADITELVTVGENIEAVKTVESNLATVNYIATQLEDFQGIYYGPLATDPTTRPDGTPLQIGDMYFNTGGNVLYIRRADAWNSIAATLTQVESTTISPTHRIGSDTVISLNAPYSVGRNSLLVFVNNVYQVGRSVSLTAGTYDETDNYTITFPNLLLEDGDEVTVVIGSVIDTINPTVQVTRSRYITQAANEQVITLPNGESYVPNSGNMEVIVNGIVMFAGVDYFETSSTIITFAEPIPEAGTEIVFKKGNLIGTDTFNITKEGDVVHLSFATDFFATRLDLDRDKTVFMRNYATANDGRSGTYIYNPTQAKSTANGLQVIDPDVPMNVQGTGAGTGVWVLQVGLAGEVILADVDAYLGSIYESL